MISDDPFGSLGSSVPSERTKKARRLSSKIAKGLSAEAAPSEKPRRRGISEQRKASSGASQEEMQRKIEILMANPKLWAEFKDVLAQSGTLTSMGTQKALREFIEKNEEISAQDAAQVEQRKRTSRLGRSLMGAVNALSLDLGSEEASRPNPPPAQRANNASSSSSTGKSRVANVARSSLTSASTMGMNLLRRAGEVASSSMSGLDEEAEQSVEANNESMNASGQQGSVSSFNNASSQDFVGVLNAWFGDEEAAIEEVPEEDNEELETGEATASDENK